MLRSVDVVIPVKDGGPMLVNAVAMWLSQELSAGWKMNLIIVNDGSVDGAPAELVRQFKNRVKIIHHEHSVGRAGARNAGAAAGTGEYIAFFDADCMPASECILQHHISALEYGADLTFGRIETRGDDFWAVYLRRVARLREQRFDSGERAALTTANCMIRRNIFDSVNGFDQEYKYYGFEDRDLILRLLGAGARAVLVDNAAVVHGDVLSLSGVARKMRTAGKFTSIVFASSHPDAYKKMDFYRVDARYHGVYFYLFARAIAPGLGFFLTIATWLLRIPAPFGLKAGIVRVCSGMAYLVGTSETSRHN